MYKFSVGQRVKVLKSQRDKHGLMVPAGGIGVVKSRFEDMGKVRRMYGLEVGEQQCVALESELEVCDG